MDFHCDILSGTYIILATAILTTLIIFCCKPASRKPLVLDGYPYPYE